MDFELTIGFSNTEVISGLDKSYFGRVVGVLVLLEWVQERLGREYVQTCVSGWQPP